MNTSLLAAAILTFVTGLVHSVLGEIALRLRELPPVPGLPAILGGDRLHPRILRATWHVATLLAWAIAAILFESARAGSLDAGRTFAIRAIALSMVGCGLVVLTGTKGRHPAWLIMFGVAALCASAAC